MGRVLRPTLPEDRFDVGPVSSGDGALVCIADVRLDNRDDLRRSLGYSEAQVARLSDAMLMMRCFERWSDGALRELVGDYAVALWNRATETLVLARDFAGQRPLFFSDDGRTLAVASLAKGLHAHPQVPRAVNEERMLQMMLGLPQEGSATFFKQVERVEPGEVTTFSRAQRCSRSFWSAPREEIHFSSPSDYADALNEKLDAAVRARLRGSHNKVATHLSAGLDSSAVTAATALASDAPILALTSYPARKSLSVPEGRFGDESALAHATAKLYPNIEHRLVRIGANLDLANLRHRLTLFERPDLNLPNLVWANRINSEAQADGVEIVLTGQMGNATISHDGIELLGQLISRGRLLQVSAELAAAHSAGVGVRTLLRWTAGSLISGGPLRGLGMLGANHRSILRNSVINPGLLTMAEELLSASSDKSEHAVNRFTDQRYEAMRKVDFGTYNKGVLLGWNIDLRDPTADRRVVDFCFSVPSEQYFRKGMPRALIRTALRKRVPDEVRLNRQRGLQSPHWFELLANDRSECRKILKRLANCEVASGLVDIATMERMLDDWPVSTTDRRLPHYRTGFLRGLVAGEFARMFSRK